jgi:GNAT superfamily N-acetyltransferase
MRRCSEEDSLAWLLQSEDCPGPPLFALCQQLGRMCTSIYGMDTSIYGIKMRRVRLGDPEAAPLLAGLTDEYDERYGENGEMTKASEDEFEPPSGLFIVLMDGATTASGGGFRRHDATTCEVKRMWTHPNYRRRGLAVHVLGALEDFARQAGYARLVLETGPRQPEAEALYVRMGYNRIAVYGHYPEARAFSLDL